MAYVFESLGYLEEAEMLYHESLGVDIQLYGNSADHGDIVVTRLKLSGIALANDCLGEAEELYRKSFEMRYRLDSEKAGASEESKALYKLGRKASKLNILVDAERLYHKCLVSIRRVHVVGLHVDVAIVMLRLSGVLFDMGRIREAEELYRASMEHIVKVHDTKSFSRSRKTSMTIQDSGLRFALRRKKVLW